MVDLRILCNISAAQLTEEQADALRGAIAEIETARAVVHASPEPIALTIARDAFAVAQALASSVVGALALHLDASRGPEARLVAYRCAALGALVGSPTAYRDSGPGTPLLNGRDRARLCGDAADMYAHAMLAAERPAGSK